jgi:multisubunit Na+/H+ antiporter MnhB subunit
MNRFIASLSVILLMVPMAMAQVSGNTAASTALQKLAEWSAPAIETIALLILIMGIAAAAFEFFKRSLGWAIGLFVGSAILFAVLYSLAVPIQNTLEQIAQTVSVSQ